MNAVAIFHHKPAYKEAPPFLGVIHPFSTHDTPLAFCQVHYKTLQDFLFHIKAKVMDGVLQNDAVQDAFQVPPPTPTPSTSIACRDAWMFYV